MDLGIKGKVAVITGGDIGGMGHATAKILAAEGAKIAIIDQTQEPLDLAVEEVR